MSVIDRQDFERDPAAWLDRVAAGEHLIIARDGRPVAELRPVVASPPVAPTRRPIGLAAGEFTVPDDFDAPLPEDILREFGTTTSASTTKSTGKTHDRQRIALIGSEVYASRVRPLLRPEDDGKFVAVEIFTGDHEIHEDDYTAVARLRSRHAEPEVWLERAGYRSAHSFGGVSRSPAK